MSPTQILWRTRAQKQFLRLHPDLQRRVSAALRLFASSGQGDIKHLHGELDNAYRLRVGGLRVLFVIEPNQTIRVTSIEPRGQAY